MTISKNTTNLYIHMTQKPQKDTETDVAVVEQVKLPRKYKVLLHNDDYSTMEFVIFVLEKFFKKSPSEAYTIMMSVHQEGVGVCGIYTREVAESKSVKVNNYAKTQGHPLKSSIEPCDD